MKLGPNFSRNMTFIIIGFICLMILALGGCASKPEKPVEKKCPKFEYTRTLIAGTNS